MNCSSKKNLEKDFSEFLTKRISQAGGSIPLQHLTGHLSQVSNEIRNVFGSSQAELLKFMKKHADLFSINNDVATLNSGTFHNSHKESDSGIVGPHSTLPEKIQNGKGVVTVLTPDYGFIKAKEPIKTDVFFRKYSFGSPDTDLTISLYIGAGVHFNAVKKEHKSSCKYRAIKVWKVDNGDLEDRKPIQNIRKNRETGIYDPITLDSQGIIQNVFPNLGFIAVKGDDQNTVFFYKNRIQNYDNIVDLTKILSRGDLVEFSAHRSTKPDAKARWEATKVWKVSGNIIQNVSNSQDISSKMSVRSKSSSEAEYKEMKKNQHGKISPRPHGAVIKFGDSELADGDSAIYYVANDQVTDIGWNYNEGEDVFFDAVKIKSAPGWKAVLVWTDKKPDIILPTCLGDFSEFTSDDEDNIDNCTSVYTSRSSSHLSVCSYSSSKTESSTCNVKQKNCNKSSDFTNGKEWSNTNINTCKNPDTFSKNDLNSLPVSKMSSHSKRLETTEFINKALKTDSGCDKSSYPEKVSIQKTDSSWDEISCPERVNQRTDSDCGENPYLEKFVQKTHSDWGESPYPEKEDYESIALSKNNDIPKTYKSEVSEDDIQSISEYASAIEDEKTDELLTKVKESTSEDDTNCRGSIQQFYDVKGKIAKVYSRFAEVESSNSKNSVSFFWNDFYLNDTSVEELEIEDLKDILKVGYNVWFNYFTIIDDSGQSWQKTTMAWCGPKPKHATEMSPEEFIEKNNLTVTVNKKGISEETPKHKVAQRKFLTSFVDQFSDKMSDKLSRTESCSDEELLTSMAKAEKPNNDAVSDDMKRLSTAIKKILRKNDRALNSVVGVDSATEEILNAVLENGYMRKSNIESSNTLFEEETVAQTSNDACSTSFKNCTKSVNSRDSEQQTIITGDIIAQNIFTDC